MSAQMKGTAASFRHEYIRETYGEAAWKAIVESLSEDDRICIDDAERGQMIPCSVEGRVLAELVRTELGGSRSMAEGMLRRGGSSQADNMLDGVFSVFARFVSPQQAFSRAGSILTSVYEGVRSETEQNPEGVGGTLHITGLGDFEYLSPWLCGWISRAVERFGGEDPVVRERSWDMGANASDHLAIEISWT